MRLFSVIIISDPDVDITELVLTGPDQTVSDVVRCEGTERERERWARHPRLFTRLSVLFGLLPPPSTPGLAPADLQKIMKKYRQ